MKSKSIELTEENYYDKDTSWHYMSQDWYVETGAFDIMVGRSSRDIVLTKEVTVDRKSVV